MFLSGEQPVGRETETHPWVGKYRGGYMAIERRLGGKRRLDAYFNKAMPGGEPKVVIRVDNVKSVEDGLRRIKCKVDWELWQRGWRAAARHVHRLVRGRIDYELQQGYRLGDLGFIGMRNDVTDWLTAFAEHDTAPLGWWNCLSFDDRLAFLHDVWECSGRPAPPGGHREKPKPKPKKPKPVSVTPRPPVQVPERIFGHCKRCKVCLAFDVNHGCCTVCGRQLTRNPVRTRSKASRKGAKKRKESRAAALRRLMRM